MITFQKIKPRLIFLAIVIFLFIFLFTACTSTTKAELSGTTYVVVIEGEGTVTSNPAGINCSDTGGVCTKVSTDVLSFTAEPKSGWAFSNWSSGEYCDSELGNQCVRSDDIEKENVNITAVFIKEPVVQENACQAVFTASNDQETKLTVKTIRSLKLVDLSNQLGILLNTPNPKVFVEQVFNKLVIILRELERFEALHDDIFMLIEGSTSSNNNMCLLNGTSLGNVAVVPNVESTFSAMIIPTTNVVKLTYVIGKNGALPGGQEITIEAEIEVEIENVSSTN